MVEKKKSTFSSSNPSIPEYLSSSEIHRKHIKNYDFLNYEF